MSRGAVKAEPGSSDGASGSSSSSTSEMYMFVLDAPISIAQKKQDNTLTYINKGVCW